MKKSRFGEGIIICKTFSSQIALINNILYLRLIKFVNKLLKFVKTLYKEYKLQVYLRSNSTPFSIGYDEYKWNFINDNLTSSSLGNVFQNNGKLPENFGIGLDERVVEYPWLFSGLKKEKLRLLDAGSALNYEVTVNRLLSLERELTIITLSPELESFWEKKVSYHFGDIRNLPFKDGWFDEVVSISTFEHIGLDNRNYGNTSNTLSSISDYKKASKELLRVLSAGGVIYLTVPFGEKYLGYWNGVLSFIQFDSISLQELKASFPGTFITTTFYKYSNSGWNIASEVECSSAKYFNIHTGEGLDQDFAAAARAVACLEIKKSSEKL